MTATMTFKENAHDSNGIVLIPADSEKNEIPTSAQVEKFVASRQGGNWKASGGWHSTGDSDEVYITVRKQ
jgi:hypothetical protein